MDRAHLPPLDPANKVHATSQRGLTLEDYYVRKQPNNFDFLRLFAAGLVLFGHSFTLILASPEHPFPHDPITLWIYSHLPFGQGLPGTGLHIFFFISGVLVTRSFLNHQTRLVDFIKARVLRIVPAYWVSTLLLACVMGPWLSTLSISDYFWHRDTWSFIWKNMSFSILYTLPGVLANNPFGPNVNGSTWTIPLELQMYGWVLLLGCVGMLRMRILFLLLFMSCLLLYCLTGNSYIFITRSAESRLWIFFFWGTLATLYADKLKISPKWMCVTGLLLGLTWQHGNPWFDVLGAAWVSYSLLVLCYYRYFKALDISRIGDFSYGVYLYAFPIQQILIHFFRDSLNGWLVALFTLVITLPVATASWYWIEKPALKFKMTNATQ